MRARFGVHNVTRGAAPVWSVTAMVMNHYQQPSASTWHEALVHDRPREQIYPTTVGNCRHLANGMAYDVPGGGTTFVDRSTWTVPFNARILAAARTTTAARRARRWLEDLQPHAARRARLLRRRRPPVQHDPPDPARARTDRQRHVRGRAGIPIAAGEVLERAALHDNSTLHVAAMGFWVLNVVPDDGVTRCAPMPNDMTRGDPARRSSPGGAVRLGRIVPQLFSRRGGVRPGGRPVGDQSSARGCREVGQRITWRFAGDDPQRDRGQRPARLLLPLPRPAAAGDVLVHADGAGHVQLTCLIHPTTMGQTLKVTRSS